MLRARVQPWIAATAGALFLFFGAGWVDIVWSFQVGFTWAMAFGLAFLLIVDRSGPSRRRDLLGMACGLAALLCSGVGVAVVAAGGVAILLPARLESGSAIVGPLALVFLLWYLTYGRGSTAPASLSQKAIFVWAIISNPFGQLAHIDGLGWLLAAILVAGTVAAVAKFSASSSGIDTSATVGLLAGAVVFALITASSRAWSVSAASDAGARSRDVYIGGRLALPAIAAGTSVLARGRPLFVVLAVAVL